MIEKSLPNEKQEQSTFKEMDNNSVTNHDQVIDEAQQDIVIQPEQNLVKTKTEPVSQSNSCSLLEETISTVSFFISFVIHNCAVIVCMYVEYIYNMSWFQYVQCFLDLCVI